MLHYPLGLLDIEHPYRCLPLYPYGLLGVFDSNNVILDKNQKARSIGKIANRAASVSVGVVAFCNEGRNLRS